MRSERVDRNNGTDSGLGELVHLGKRLGVSGIYILFPIAVGRWDESYINVLTEEERDRARRLLDFTCVHYELSTETTLCCYSTKSIIYISANGDMSPCPFMPFRLGNIKNYPLKELWSSHFLALDFKFRGSCPLNNKTYRENIREHIETVAAAFKGVSGGSLLRVREKRTSRKWKNNDWLYIDPEYLEAYPA